MKDIQDGIEDLLEERGWTIDRSAKKLPGENHRKWIHPLTGLENGPGKQIRFDWLGAVYVQMMIDFDEEPK